jgi:hypothetical protein
MNAFCCEGFEPLYASMANGSRPVSVTETHTHQEVPDGAFLYLTLCIEDQSRSHCRSATMQSARLSAPLQITHEGLNAVDAAHALIPFSVHCNGLCSVVSTFILKKGESSSRNPLPKAKPSVFRPWINSVNRK